MRAKQIFEFTRNTDPLYTLGIGRVGKIRKWARDLGISDERYEITPTEVIFKDTLDLRNTNVDWLPDGLKLYRVLYLSGCTELTSLPDGLKVGGSLDLRGCTGLTSLPDGLQVDWRLYLNNCTGLTSLPDDLIVGDNIWVNPDQDDLIGWIRTSIFSNKLRV